jgi:hypothetical protein
MAVGNLKAVSGDFGFGLVNGQIEVTRRPERAAGPGCWTGLLDRAAGPGCWTGLLDRAAGAGERRLPGWRSAFRSHMTCKRIRLRSRVGNANFLRSGLTRGARGPYIALTKGGSQWAAGFVDFRAIVGRNQARVGPGCLCRFCAGLLFDIVMEGREAQAAGPCGSDGFGLAFGPVLMHLDEGTLVCVLREPRTLALGFGPWLESAVTRQYSDRPVADRFRLRGHWEDKHSVSNLRV